MRWRLGLAPLMALIAVLAVGLAAMKVASAYASGGAWLGLIVAILVPMLGARVRRHRAPWAGFALFGQAYLLYLAFPMFGRGMDSTYVSDLPRIDLPSLELADWLHPAPPEPSRPAFFFGVKTNDITGVDEVPSPTGKRPLTNAEEKARSTYLTLSDDREDRLQAHARATRIGLAIQGLVFASLGAFIGHQLARTDRRPSEPDARRPPTEAQR